jgi:hypothetical protein
MRARARHGTRLAAGALLLAWAGATSGADSSVIANARVVEVWPVTLPGQAECSGRDAVAAGLPAAGDVRRRDPALSLGAALEQELRYHEARAADAACRPRAYRVRYRLDGRLHETTTPERPGAFVRVRVRLGL